MGKLSSDKKFYIVLATVVFFGFTTLGLAGAYLWAQKASNSSTEPVSQAAGTNSEEKVQAQEKLHQECIDRANELYAEYVAKTPEKLPLDARTAHREALSDIRDTHKEDCDRQYIDK